MGAIVSSWVREMAERASMEIETAARDIGVNLSELSLSTVHSGGEHYVRAAHVPSGVFVDVHVDVPDSVEYSFADDGLSASASWKIPGVEALRRLKVALAERSGEPS
jgi:hypothetical protein